MEHLAGFRSIKEWQQFSSAHPELFDPAKIRGMVEYLKSYGLLFRFDGRLYPPSEIEVAGDNYRESIRVRGLNVRQRAVLDLLAAWPPASEIWGLKILALEALSHFALALRGRYPRFIGCEYVEDPVLRRSIYPVPAEDPMKLSFADSAFDCCIACELLERISDPAATLREAARILRPGGLALATFPFLAGQQESLLKEVSSGDGAGVAVARIPGWEILDWSRAAGFSDTEMVFFASQQRGIVTADCAGVFVLRCVR